MLDLAASYDAIRNGVVQFSSRRDVVRVSGPDSLSYLEGQCSQHVSDIAHGESRETLLLSPQGKVEAYATVTLNADGDALVIVDEGCGEVTFQRLRRFKLRVKAELELVQWSAIAVRGPKADVAVEGGAFAARYGVQWPGCAGFDLVGEVVRIDDALSVGDPAALEVAWIEAGIPKMGFELTEKTIPQEAGITERAVNFTKGCYTGQELVARIDARGNNVPRRLRSVIFGADLPADLVLEGATLIAGDKEIGHVTSAAFSPRLGRRVGLCYVARAIEVPSEARVVVVGEPDGIVTLSQVPLIS